MSTNVFCSNCGQGYNLTSIIPTADKISRDMHYCDNEQVKARYELEHRFGKET